MAVLNKELKECVLLCSLEFLYFIIVLNAFTVYNFFLIISLAVLKKELKEFTREIAIKNEDKNLKTGILCNIAI